jgi:hypothetical protein
MQRQQNDPLLLFRQVAMTMMRENPDIFSHLAQVLRSVANSLDDTANKLRENVQEGTILSLEGGNETTMTSFQFQEKLVDMMMRKISLSHDDVSMICQEGRGHEVLRMLETLQRPSATFTSLSRREK